MFFTILITLTKIIPFFGTVMGKSFPEKLNPDEERELLLLLENKDRNAREKLIKHNLRLVAHVVKKYENYSSEKEDLLSIGTLGLIKGIDSYSLSKGTKLATYTARCIENEILMHIRSKKKSRNDISIHEPIGYDKEGNEISLIDVITDNEVTFEDELIKKESIKELFDKINILSELEMDVICRRYGLNGKRKQTQLEIANDLGISRSYISRIEKKAYIKLHKEIDI